MKSGLEKHYSGDQAWTAYSILYDKFWNENSFQLELLDQLNCKLDIAKVIYGIVELNSLIWIHTKIPALDNLTPVECITNSLENRLKEMLMRMDI